MNISDQQQSISQAKLNAQNFLTDFATSEKFLADIYTAFREDINLARLEQFAQQWQENNFDSFPNIEIRSSAEIDGANGAFSIDTNKIYLAQEFIVNNDSDALTNLILEEYGHFVDSQINTSDAPGDEGDIFAALVRGEELSEDELRQLKSENDGAVVIIDGLVTEIEQAKLAIISEPIVNTNGDAKGKTESFLAESFEDEKLVWNLAAIAGTVDPELFDSLVSYKGATTRFGNPSQSDLLQGHTFYEINMGTSGEEVRTLHPSYETNLDRSSFEGQSNFNINQPLTIKVEPENPTEEGKPITVKLTWQANIWRDLNANFGRIGGTKPLSAPGNSIDFSASLENQQLFDFSSSSADDNSHAWSLTGDSDGSSTIITTRVGDSFDIDISAQAETIFWINDDLHGDTGLVLTLESEIELEEEEECPETGILSIEVAGGKFEDTDGDGLCDAEGTIYIGLENGINRMLRIENARARQNDENLTIVAGTVYSEIDGISAPLFEIEDNFVISYDTATATFTENVSFPNDFEIGGLDINFNELRLQPSALGQSAILLDGDFILPENLLKTEVKGRGNNALFVDLQGVGFGSESGTIPLEYQTQGLELFANLGIVPGTLNLSYEEQDNRLLLNGKIGVSNSLITAIADPGNLTGGSFTLNLEKSKSKFIQVQDGIADIDGTIEAKNLELLFGFDLPDIEVNLKSTRGELTEIGGKTSIKLPFFQGKTFLPDEIKIELGGKVKPEITLDDVILTGKGLNIPIPNNPLLFLNEITGGVRNLNPTSTETLDYKGGIGISLLPKTSFPLKEDNVLSQIFELQKIEGSVVKTNFDLTTGFQETKADPSGKLVSLKVNSKSSFLSEKLIRTEGELQWNWHQEFIKGKQEINVLDGFLVSNANLNVNYKKNKFSVVARATSGRITFPNNALFLGAAGETFSEGVNFGLKYSDDGNSFNDVGAAWTAVNIPIIDKKIALGIKFNFNGDFNMIFSGKEIPIFNSWQIAPETSWIVISANWENTVDRDVRVRVIDESGNSIEEADFAANNIAIVEDLSNSNTRTVVIDRPDAGVWDLEIVDDSGLGEVEFTAFEDTTAPTIDILAASPDANNPGSFIIDYNATDADSEAAITLFYDTDNEEFDGGVIAENLVEQDGAGNFVWTPGNLAPGEYYVYGTILDENNAPVSQYAPQPIVITGSADLAISRDISREPVSTGTELTYTVTVTNNGADLAKNVSITEVLPEGATFVSATVDSSLQENNTVSLNLGDLDNETSTSLDITIAVPNTIGSATISSILNSDTFDPVLGNDDDIAVIEIVNGQSLAEIAIDDISVSKNSGATESIFTVSLSEASTETITVDFASANVTAVSGEDYTAVEGTLEFAPGETEQTITVELILDGEEEENEEEETFFVNLNNPTNAVIADNNGVGIITNTNLSVENVSLAEATEGNTEYIFTAILSEASSETISVNYTTQNGSAISGEDYTAVEGTLEFAPGETEQTITVEVLSDDVFEPEEFFTVDLSNPNGVNLVSDRATGIITNNEIDTLKSTEETGLIANLDNNDDSYIYQNETYYYDFFALPVDSSIGTGDIVTVTLASENFDPILMILDAEGNVLEYNDNANEGSINSELTFIVGAEDSFFVSVETKGANQTGDYLLDVDTINVDVSNPENTPLTIIDSVQTVDSLTGNLSDTDIASSVEITGEDGSTETFNIFEDNYLLQGSQVGQEIRVSLSSDVFDGELNIFEIDPTGNIESILDEIDVVQGIGTTETADFTIEPGSNYLISVTGGTADVDAVKFGDYSLMTEVI